MAKIKKTTTLKFPRIYVGHTINKLSLKQFTVFCDGVPSWMQVNIKKHPTLRQLIVPVSDLTKAREQLKDKNSVLFNINKKLGEEINGKL